MSRPNDESIRNNNLTRENRPALFRTTMALVLEEAVAKSDMIEPMDTRSMIIDSGA